MRRLPTKLLRNHWGWSACLLTAGLSLGGDGMAQAVEPAVSSLRLSGFGTAGVSRSSAPPGWGFQRDGTQPGNDGGLRLDTDSRLGLQANYAIDPRFEWVGQLLLTRRRSNAPASDAIGWAFAAYRPTDGLTVRAGRMSVNFYQLSDYRSVGLAYPFVRPPPEFYGLLPSVVDGLDVTRSWRDGGDALWKLAGYFGQAKQIESRSGSFREVRPVYGVLLSREDQGLTLQATVSRGRIENEAAAAALAPLTAGLQSVTRLPVPQVAEEATWFQRELSRSDHAGGYMCLSASFDRDDWLVMTETSRTEFSKILRIDAGYVLIGRRFGRATPYAALSAVRTRSSADKPEWAEALAPALGPEGAAQVQALGDAAYDVTTTGPRQTTWSVGMRWDLSAQGAVKVQYDRSRIGARGSLLWSNGTDEAARAHVLTTTLDFIF